MLRSSSIIAAQLEHLNLIAIVPTAWGDGKPLLLNGMLRWVLPLQSYYYHISAVAASAEATVTNAVAAVAVVDPSSLVATAFLATHNSVSSRHLARSVLRRGLADVYELFSS